MLNQLDNRDFGATLLSAPAVAEPAPEPNREFIRACLRFRDDGRDWSGDILLETSDGEVKRAVCAGLGGETALVRLDGVERMAEFSRFTGVCGCRVGGQAVHCFVGAVSRASRRHIGCGSGRALRSRSCDPVSAKRNAAWSRGCLGS